MLDVSICSMLLPISNYEEKVWFLMQYLIVNVEVVFSLVRHHSTAEDSRWLLRSRADGINLMESTTFGFFAFLFIYSNR